MASLLNPGHSVTSSSQLSRGSQRVRVSSRCSRRLSLCRAQQHDEAGAAVAESATLPQSDPQISLQFFGPGDAEVAEFSLGSGTKNLRRAMIDAKVPLYDIYGSLMNCGGGGSCGTCLVEVKDGAELLSGKTDAEGKYLKKKPESWRLACQTIVGDKINSGKVIIRTMPQKK